MKSRLNFRYVTCRPTCTQWLKYGNDWVRWKIGWFKMRLFFFGIVNLPGWTGPLIVAQMKCQST